MTQDPIDAYDAYLNDMEDLERGTLTERDLNFEANIQCARCGYVTLVGGSIWAGRLSGSRTEQIKHQGLIIEVHTGWNCDPCADALEAGLDPY